MHISILGGGPAGLAVGYYSQKYGTPFTLYEAARQVGGNAVTLTRGDFLFDSGAHRLHDKDPEVTRELKQILAEDLKEIHAPSRIYYNGKFIDFPLSPLNLLTSLGPVTCARVGLDITALWLNGKKRIASFEDRVTHAYGRTIAELFLLNYSEKLWGLPCHALSRDASGKRMKGLCLNTLLVEALLGQRKKTKHLDGAFYYPRKGIGMVAQRLAKYCGEENIRRGARITRIFHSNGIIESLEINGMQKIAVEEVVSTLPLPLFLSLMQPQPDRDILDASRGLRFRNLILVALFLDRDSVSDHGTLYFPDAAFPFTRIHEPKNRSADMAPSGKTSIVAEIPCAWDDARWNQEDKSLIRLVRDRLAGVGLLRGNEVMDATVRRFMHAYPILDMGYEGRVQRILAYLDRFANLKCTGRSGRFMYAHIHDWMRYGIEIAKEFLDARECQVTTNPAGQYSDYAESVKGGV